MGERWAGYAAGWVLLAAVSSVAAQPAADVVGERIRAKYPNTQFRQISKTAVPGIYEVVMGQNVAYSDESGRYFFFGRLFDMEQQRDLTEPRMQEVGTIDVSTLPLELAIKSVRGSGRRTLVVFSDPDCPFCKRLEQSLEKVGDVTIYTFVYPLSQIHPDARRKAIAVWCSADRDAAWRAWMTRGVEPAAPAKDCVHPVDRIVALAQQLGIRGTPTMFSGDGRRVSGALGAEAIESFLSATKLAAGGAQ
jgi:thiol:disulfide interchange protein DsbC